MDDGDSLWLRESKNTINTDFGTTERHVPPFFYGRLQKHGLLGRLETMRISMMMMILMMILMHVSHCIQESIKYHQEQYHQELDVCQRTIV